MTRIVIAFALLAVLAGAADIASTTASLTSGSFAAAPATKVIDASTTTAADYASWGTDYDRALFGPGATNSTLYLYGIDRSGTALTKVISRALNASLLSNGTAATAASDAKIGTDGVWAAALTTLTTTPTWGVGLGSVAIAYVAPDTATVPCRQVYLAILNGGASSPLVTKQVTSNTCTKCTQGTAGTGTGYAISLGNVYYDNATYWVSYTQTLFTETETNPTQTSCTAAPTATSGTVIVATNYKSYVQGVAATSTGALAWTAVPELYSSTTAAPSVDPTCGPSNWTNSTNIYCVYKDAATNKNLVLQPVAMADGTKGTSVTLATDSNTGTAGNADNVVKVFTLAGFVASQYQQGVLINNNTGTGATLAYTNNLNIYNTTSGAAAQTAGGAIVGATYTNSLQSGVYTGAGTAWVEGYGIIDGYVSSTTTTPSTYTYEYGSFLSNSTVNVTKTTIGTVQAGYANYFADANGALWFGAVTYDTANSNGFTGATIGKLVAQIYASGNILASFFALLSLMIAALFAF